MDWLMSNLATIAIGFLLLAAVVLAVLSIIKTHRNGGCTGSCTGCPSSGRCRHLK